MATLSFKSLKISQEKKDLLRKQSDLELNKKLAEPIKETVPLKKKPSAPPVKKNKVNKEKRAKRARYKNHVKGIKLFVERFPEAFNFQYNKPLKKNINKDLLIAFEKEIEEKQFSKSFIEDSVIYYVSKLRYLYNFLNSSNRHDLQGKPVAKITEEEKKKAHSKRIKYILETLYYRFPKCFNIRRRKPLKIGILDDILKDRRYKFERGIHKISKTLLKEALHIYTSNHLYLAGFEKAVNRIDLEGEPAAPLTPPEKAYASQAYVKCTTDYAKKKEKSQELNKSSIASF